MNEPPRPCFPDGENLLCPSCFSMATATWRVEELNEFHIRCAACEKHLVFALDEVGELLSQPGQVIPSSTPHRYSRQVRKALAIAKLYLAEHGPLNDQAGITKNESLFHAALAGLRCLARSPKHRELREILKAFDPELSDEQERRALLPHLTEFTKMMGREMSPKEMGFELPDGGFSE